MAIDKKSFTNAIKKGIDAVGGYLSYNSTSESKLKGDVADIKAVNMFMNKIPQNVPAAVKQQAKSDISSYVKAGNYKKARDYIANLNS